MNYLQCILLIKRFTAHSYSKIIYKYWRLSRNVLNKNKFYIPTLFCQLEGLSFTADKAEGFAQKCPSNSTVDSSGIYLPDFSHRRESLLSNRHIITFMISAIISKLDPTMFADLVVSLQFS